MTYSDLVTLLLVFFVLLYTLTPGIDRSTFNDFISYFQKSVGIMDQSAIASQEAKQVDDLREEWQQIKKFLEEQGLASEVDIQKIPEGVKVTLSDSLTFNSGSALLLEDARTVLGEMAKVIGHDIKEVKVQGHTDNVPIARHSVYRSNWHLGAARAVSVVQFIHQRSRLIPGRFEASSFGEYKPIATNATTGGRRKNRRVEIYIRYLDEELTGGFTPDSLSQFTEMADSLKKAMQQYQTTPKKQ